MIKKRAVGKTTALFFAPYNTLKFPIKYISNMKSELHIIKTGPLQVNTYIVPLFENKVFVVDPADNKICGDGGKVTDYLKNKKLDCVGIFITHSHFDHILGIADLKNEFPNAKVGINSLEAGELNCAGPMNSSILYDFSMNDLLGELQKQPPAEVFLDNGKTFDSFFQNETEGFKKAAAQWEVIHTPGHSPGSVCFYNKQEKLLICGDTLFDNGGYGRTDMFGGSEKEILKSISQLKEKVLSGTKVYPGHETFGFTF